MINLIKDKTYPGRLLHLCFCAQLRGIPRNCTFHCALLHLTPNCTLEHYAILHLAPFYTYGLTPNCALGYTILHLISYCALLHLKILGFNFNLKCTILRLKTRKISQLRAIATFQKTFKIFFLIYA